MASDLFQGMLCHEAVPLSPAVPRLLRSWGTGEAGDGGPSWCGRVSKSPRPGALPRPVLPEWSRRPWHTGFSPQSLPHCGSTKGHSLRGCRAEVFGPIPQNEGIRLLFRWGLWPRAVRWAHGGSLGRCSPSLWSRLLVCKVEMRTHTPGDVRTRVHQVLLL